VLTKRIIACMDVRDGQVVKGVQFQQLRHAGDPAELAQRYNVEGIDEVVVLDITATLESRQALARTISAVAHRIFLPLTVGGGIRKEDDAAAAVDAGGRQGQPQHRGIEQPRAHHHACTPIRQPGRDRRDRCEAPRKRIRGLCPKRNVGRGT
jgi:cyclase